MGGGVLLWLETPDEGWRLLVDGRPGEEVVGPGILHGVAVAGGGAPRSSARYRPPRLVDRRGGLARVRCASWGWRHGDGGNGPLLPLGDGGARLRGGLGARARPGGGQLAVGRSRGRGGLHGRHGDRQRAGGALRAPPATAPAPLRCSPRRVAAARGPRDRPALHVLQRLAAAPRSRAARRLGAAAAGEVSLLAWAFLRAADGGDGGHAPAAGGAGRERAPASRGGSGACTRPTRSARWPASCWPRSSACRCWESAARCARLRDRSGCWSPVWRGSLEPPRAGRR